MMSVEWRWSLGLLHASDNGIVRAVDWLLTGEHNGRRASRAGRCWLGEPSEDFVPIALVGDAHLVDWISNRVAIDGVKAGILQDLNPLDGALLYASETDPLPIPAPEADDEPSTGAVVEPTPETEAPAIIVPDALSGLAIAGEAPGETKARLAGRWVELTHLLQMGLADGELAAEHTLLSAHQAWLTS